MNLFFVILLCCICGNCLAYSGDCGPVFPTASSTACESISNDEKTNLIGNAIGGFQSILTALRALNNTMKTDPDVASLSFNDFGQTYNPLAVRTENSTVGKAGYLLRKCYFPILVNVTAGEYEQKMDCPESNEYSNQTFGILMKLLDLVIYLKKLASSDPRLSSGPECSVISDPICIQPRYSTRRAADGQLFTSNQERVRKTFGLVNTLIYYFSDLSRNSYFT